MIRPSAATLERVAEAVRLSRSGCRDRFTASAPALGRFWRRLGGLAACVLLAPALAADESPPSAKVLGPQSPVEHYNAPVQQPAALDGVIDFPSLIAAPGPHDGAQVMPALRQLEIEIVGTDGVDGGADDFVRFTGASRTGDERAALYAALRTKLAARRDRPLTLGDARAIQQDIAAVYQAQGFPLMSVVVPPQEVRDGRLRVQVNEFRLAALSVQYGRSTGAYAADAPHWSSDAKLQALLSPLLADPIVRRAVLDAKVKAINRNPFRSARVVFEPGDAQGQSKAVFQIDEKRPWSVQAGYNNYATKASGTNRYSVGGSFGNLPLEGQQVSWNATVGDRVQDFQNYSLIYTAPLAWGHTVSANVNYSDTASSTIPGVNSASTTLQSSLSYDLPLLARGDFSWDLNATALLKQFERASLFGGVNVGGAKFDSTQLSVNNQFNWKESTATNQIVFTVVQSFSGLTAHNTDEDFQKFYNRASGGATTTHYILNYARVQQLKPLAAALDGWSTETQLSWQFTGDSLAGADDFSIGGPSVLRAYQASEINGDQGLYGIQFLHAKPLAGAALGALARVIQQVNLSAFVEAGQGSFRGGGRESVWDGGVQASVAARGGFNCSASLAFAGKATAQTDAGDTHCFVSAQWRY